MESWIAIISGLLGGLGVGSLISLYFGQKFELRKMIFQEKLACYNGILESYQNAVAECNEANRQKFVYWQQRIAMVAPIQIIELSEKFYEERSENQPIIRNSMVKEMRKDLGF